MIGTLGTALFVVVLLNAVNFMDGSNGLAAGAVAVALAGLGYAALRTGHPAAAALAFTCAAANLGYLAWNFPGGRLFQGDVGALFSAMVLAGVGVIVATPGDSGATVSPYLVVFAALPLLVDVLLTLAVRIRNRERLFHAHRRHLYQLWLARTGRSHAALAWRVWVLTAATTGVGLVLEIYAADARLPVLAITTLFLGLAWAAYRRRLT